MKKNNIMLAGENRLFIDSIRTLLEKEADFEVTGCASSGVETIKKAIELSPDMIVADQQLPDINLLQVTREVRSKLKNPSFVLIIREETPELISILSEIQNIGVVRCNCGVPEFITALHTVARGENYINSDTIANLRSLPQDEERSGDPLAVITPREKEILYWLSRGHTNKEISSILILSEKTVKNHVSHILRKLDLTDRTKAAALAWSEGLPLLSEEFFL